MTSQAPRILSAAGLAMHYGLDPLIMLTSDDPILDAVLGQAIEAAQRERRVERQDLATRIANAIAKSQGGS